jgi:hypothetical protein
MTRSRAHTSTTTQRERPVRTWENPYDPEYLDDPFSRTSWPTWIRDHDLDRGR